MRPQSEIRITLAAALIDGPGTTRELAQRTGWAIGMTRETLNNMVHAGDARKRYTRVPGVCRPVPVYERAVRARDIVEAAQPHQSLIAAWMGRPLHHALGAAM